MHGCHPVQSNPCRPARNRPTSVQGTPSGRMFLPAPEAFPSNRHAIRKTRPQFPGVCAPRLRADLVGLSWPYVAAVHRRRPFARRETMRPRRSRYRSPCITWPHRLVRAGLPKSTFQQAIRSQSWPARLARQKTRPESKIWFEDTP